MAINSLFFGARSRAFALGVLFLTLFAVGCSQPEDQKPVPTASVWTLNEGQFLRDNSSIIPYNPTTKVAAPSDLFASANGGAALGDIATSIYALGEQLWVPISNSGKLYILDPASGKLVNKIVGLNSPRYVYRVNDTKGYISNLNKPEIAIVNPQTLAVTGAIAVETAAEMFVSTSKGLFVNLWSSGKKIAKIDPATDKVVASIEVGVQPTSMVADQNENLWVVCDGGGWEGNPAGFEKPSLVKLNAEATAVLHKWELPSTGGFSFRVATTDGGASVLVLNGNVYKVAANATALPTTPLITLPAKVTGYSMGVDPENGDIYVGDAVDYQQRGTVYRYDKEGKLIDQYTAGICPSFYYFQPTK